MKKRPFIIAIIVLAVLVTAVMILRQVGKATEKPSKGDFTSYIAAHTAGTISTIENIRVVFATAVIKPEEAGKAADSRLLKLRPAVKGSLVWDNERTLKFIPEVPLEGDREFSVNVDLSRIYQDIPQEFHEFIFIFRTIKQDIELVTDGLEFYDDPGREDRRVAGRILTADFADHQIVKDLLVAKQGNKNLEISWNVSDDSRRHNFRVEGVRQSDQPEKIILTVNGRKLGVDYNETIEFDIPARGKFRVLSHNVIQTPEQYLEIRFSEPLDPSQNIDGLIRVTDNPEVRIITEGNLVKIYPVNRLAGNYDFEVSAGIRAIHQQRLEEPVLFSATFEVIKPQVRLVGQGVIMPTSGGLYFPFQAVSLRAVDVTITRIFEQNIAQFLQSNNLRGESDLRRVGRRILRKTILLDQQGPVDFNSWNTYHIDLADLIKAEPGAIYQVNIDFRMEYSTYDCNGSDNQQPIRIIDERYDPRDDLIWQYYDWGDFNWRERDNPCHPTYYRYQSVSRNVLASDLGLIAKSGTDGSMVFVATDLNTGQPSQNVNVEILNYQQQVIARGVTNSQGLAEFKFGEEMVPFLAIAKSGNHRGYLKLDRGSSLSLSAFDVSGTAVQKGLKGFLYGERGVWRPGDTLFISFILEDKERTLPANHPVTFEMTNSRGQLIHRNIATRSTGGIYSFPVATDQDAPTGNYRAEVKVGGAVFSEIFKVETVMPNRLKINLTIDDDALRHGKTTTARFESNWLHGAPARNLKVKVDAILSQSTTTFDGYSNFIFDDPARRFEAEEQTIFEGRLDASGKTNFNPRISIKTAAPGKLNANFTARVFEEGGAFSIDRFTLPYYPYQTFVGLGLPESQRRYGRFFTDTTHVIELVSLSAEGKPVPNKEINIEVYKIDWRWWWERRNEDLSGFISGSYHRPLQRAKVTTDRNGKATWNLRINHPEWGRFLIRAVDGSGGHAAGTVIYMDWPGWIARDRQATPEAASMLVFASNKEKYNVGENIHLTIPSPDKGKIFLTVESGTHVLETHWVDATKGETTFTLAATKEMSPNVFINAMLLQPHAQTANDLPIRMYGMVPIGVEDPNTHITPVIKMPDVLEPEKKVSITVSEKDGKPMAFTLALVDDGLLDLTRFRTPDPWGRFYAREALGVNTWDLYDLVLGATTGRMQRILSVGGDEEAIVQGDKTANRFKPVVRYFGPFEVGRGRSQNIEFTMPNYIGSVRVMAVAAKEGAYGSAEKTVPVKKPLMTLATLPRVLGPEEDVVLPVTVFSMDENIRNVKVRVETNELLNLQGSGEQTIRFDSPGDQVVRFNLKAAARLGVGRVKVIAESGRERATYEIELNVRNPNPPMTLVKDTIINKGDTWRANYNAFGIRGTNTASIEISTLPPINLGKRLNFLIGYPHGCLEQTVSRAFPQLFISKLAEVDDKVKSAAEQNVRHALDNMRRFRNPEGGLTLWPGAAYPDSWGTVYAGHFMLEAQRLGYSLPAGIMDGWTRSTQRAARNWSQTHRTYYGNNDLMQAYRLYVLAMAKSPEMGAMNRLRETPDLSVAARWRLAAAYVLAGNPEAARSIIDNVPTEIKPYREQAFTYGSHIRDMAMILETLVLLNDMTRAMPLLQEISKTLSSDSWMSTQEISFCLLAFSKFAESDKTTGGSDARISIHGQQARRFTSQRPVLQHAFEPVQSGQGRVEITNNGDGILFARLINHGIPLAGQEVAQSNNIRMEVKYSLMDGSAITPAAIAQGTDFYAEVTITNPGTRMDLEQLILAYIVPSGWEIRSSRLDEGEQALASSAYEYQDIRDDRVYTYFNLPRGTAKTFRIRFNAAYEGRFYMPGISCEAMYDNSINARNMGSWVEVRLP
jgi:alpha-2-macroglobulin